MKGREAKGAPSADLLVCFPSRAHLTLMPKPFCSPARPSEANKRINHHRHSQSQHQHHLKKLNTKGAGHASPLMWAKTKPTGPEIAEPTSPKVTCAGQIKVRPKANSCKSWQSVMEEIERIHNNRNKRKNKRPSWAESIGLKKEVMQFLTCLKSIRFDFRCFGAFPQADITTDDEDDEDEDEDQCHESNHVGAEGSDGNTDQASSRTVFSKWFMVLQENQNNCYYKEEKERSCSVEDSSAAAPAAPPPNALLLMRCRSAPAKSRFQDKAGEKEDDDHEEKEEKKVIQVKKTNNLKSLMEEERRNNKENLVVMAYDTDFYKISSDIAKETWIVDGTKDLLSRSRSWKR